MSNLHEPMLDGPSGCSMAAIFSILIPVAALSLLLVLLPTIIYWVIWVICLIGALALLIFSVWDTAKNHHLLSIPIGILILGYSVFAAPVYKFLYFFSGNFTYYQASMYGVSKLQNNKTYLYAGLIAFGVFTVVSIAFLLGNKLKAVAHVFLALPLAAILICSIAIPISVVVRQRSTELALQQQGSPDLKEYVVTKKTGLYLGAYAVEDKGMHIDTDTLFFPDVPLIPKLPIASLPVGTVLLTDGSTATGYDWQGNWQSDKCNPLWVMVSGSASYSSLACLNRPGSLLLHSLTHG